MRGWRCSPIRVGIEYRQLYTHHFIEKGMFLQYVFKQSALCLIACLISSQERSVNKAEQQVLLVQSTVVAAPKEKNQAALNQALRIATTEWGLILAHNSGTTCLRVHVPSQKMIPPARPIIPIILSVRSCYTLYKCLIGKIISCHCLNLYNAVRWCYFVSKLKVFNHYLLWATATVIFNDFSNWFSKHVTMKTCT